MSCPNCDAEERVAYYRWKNANVGIIGCNEHLKEIFEVLDGKKRGVEDPIFRIRKEEEINENDL